MDKEKILTLKKTRREFFRAYVEILKPFLKKLRSKDADVFAELLYQNSIKSDIKNKKDRFKLIFDADNRKEMEEHLKMSSQTFRNSLTNLRYRNLLEKDNTIPDLYLIVPDREKFALKFNFVFEN